MSQPVVLVLVAGLVSAVPPRATAATVRSYVSGTALAENDGARVVAVCRLEANGLPASTHTWCTVNDVMMCSDPDERLGCPVYSPLPHGAATFWGFATIRPVWACAHGYATYRDLTKVWATPECIRLA